MKEVLEESEEISWSRLMKGLLYLALVAGVVALVVFSFGPTVSWLRLQFLPPSASVGDVFNAVSAFYSAMAFGMLILTVVLQGYELSLQRKELKETRTVLHRQAESLATQQFDSTFFNLLNLHGEIVGSLALEERRTSRAHTPAGVIEVSTTPQRFDGRRVFHAILEDLLLYTERLQNAGEIKGTDTILRRAYAQTFSHHGAFL